MSEIAKVIQNQEIESYNNEQVIHDSDTQYLSFVVGDEEFAVNILSVQEIRAWEKPTFLPNSPRYVMGVLNLRGTIVPVIDLRKRFNFQQFSYSETTVIVILKNINDDKEKLMGCVVDGVSDVFNIDDSSIGSLPNNSSSIDGRFVEGVMTVNDHAVTLLELNNLLSLKFIIHPFTGGSVSNA